MFPEKLKSGVRFKLNNEVYTILKRLPGMKIEVQDSFNEIKIFTNEELIKYLCEGKLLFECIGKNTVKRSDELCTSFVFNNIENEKHKDQAIFRFEAIKPIIGMPYLNRNYKTIQQRVDEINSWSENPKLAQENLNGCTYYKKVSYISLYRWIRDYFESNGDFRVLLPSYYNSGGKDKPRMPQEVLKIIQDLIEEKYSTQQRISCEELRHIVLNKIAEENEFLSSSNRLQCPSRATFARIISNIPEYERVAKRIGKRTAFNQFNPVMAGVSATYPLERVEIDHTPIDIMLVDENGTCVGRPYLIMAIDKCTTQILGFSIGQSDGVGWSEVMLCIKNIMTDKSYVNKIYPSFINNKWSAFGIPKKIVIDNGHEFKNKAMMDAAYQLGYELQFCPPKLPQWKASIERSFGIMNSGLFHNMPGTTRSNYQKLGDDENPEKLAKFSFPVFLAIVHKWIVDIYSQTISKSTGQKPADLWEKLIDEYPVSWPNNISEIAVALGKTCSRKITRRGIEMDTLRYNSIELNKLLMKFSKENSGFEQSFQIKYDPYDLGEIFVYDHLINKEWIKVPCVNYEYAKNLTDFEHKSIKAHSRNHYTREDEESLAKSKADIRKLFDNGTGYTPKQIARANRVNSENEITTRLQEQEKTQLFKLETQRGKDVSDIGHKIIVPNNIIIPQQLENQYKNGNINDKVIPIKNKKKYPKSQSNSSHTKDEDEFNINSIDFSQFTVFSNQTEVGSLDKSE